MNDLDALAKRMAKDIHGLTGERVLERQEALIRAHLDSLRLMPKDLQEFEDEQDRTYAYRTRMAVQHAKRTKSDGSA